MNPPFSKAAGVRIGIVDDGLQTAHPDLAPNVDTANDHDWNDATPNDPNPSVVNGDFHASPLRAPAWSASR